MITIGWGAVFVFLFCMFSLGFMPEGNDSARWAILALAVVAFLAGFFAFGAHRAEEIHEDHPDALGSLDLLQRNGSGGDGAPHGDPTRQPSPPLHRPVSPYFDRSRGAR